MTHLSVRLVGSIAGDNLYVTICPPISFSVGVARDENRPDSKNCSTATDFYKSR